MRLSNAYLCLCQNGRVCQVSSKSSPLLRLSTKSCLNASFLLLQFGLLFGQVATAPSDAAATHLLPTGGSSEKSGVAGMNGDAVLKGGKVGLSSSGESERSGRARDIFRLELLRQINAIDHMKCFPKVLCGLSVDSDKSFGINKSNFVRSYLELMRNIKPAPEGVDYRIRTEAEVEGELVWPFSPHNPDRKHHSSFERISSAAMSASVEHGDSLEYLSRGLDSRVLGDSSISEEKVDRMGIPGSLESKEKFSLTGNIAPSHATTTKMDSSKIPGDKKKKKNSNKSLTSKITSYFTSWLPDIVSFGRDSEDDSTEKDDFMDDAKRMSRNMKDKRSIRINSNWPLSSSDSLSQLPTLESFKGKHRSTREARADDTSTETEGDANVARDGIHHDSAEHDADIYHTAVNIGKRLKDPKQCDYIYNGCPLEYTKILEMISSIRTDIQPHEDTAEAVSHELGLDTTTSTTTSTTSTTTTTTTTTTRRPQRKKPRPSTKIMHVLPNGEKVEINFRLGGSEDSEESSSAQRDYAKKEFTDDEETSAEKNSKGEDEVVVVDLGQRSALSTEEVQSSEKRIISKRKGAPVDMVVVKNKSNKKKAGYTHPMKDIMSQMGAEGIERSGELAADEDIPELPKPSAMASLLTKNSFNKHKPALKLSGLTLTTDGNDEQPLEISPSYVIIKHQPLSVHTTSLLSPENMQSSPQQMKPVDRLQTFQLIQNGQQVDADQITDQLKNYIRQNGGLIPKLSLHSSGLITTDPDSMANAQNQFSLLHQISQAAAVDPTTSQRIYQSLSHPVTTTASNTGPQPVSKLSLSHLSNSPFKSSIPQSPYSTYPSLYANNGPAMLGAVPGRLDAYIQAKTTSTSTTTSTTTSTPSTTTEKMILPGMQETLTLDTEEITDDTMDKLSAQDSVPVWITPSPSSLENEESNESDEEKIMLENLNKTYLNDNANGSKTRYKSPKKKKPKVKANSSRVRNSTSKRNKGSKKRNNSNASGSEESLETERVVIKHAGPYSGSPTVYKSPLKGPGPHGGAYPYLTGTGMQPYSNYPFWRL